MNTPNEQLEAIREMRTMMERSSRFISLSGLSGLAIGIIALTGAGALYYHLELMPFASGYAERMQRISPSLNDTSFQFVFIDALVILLASLIAGTWMSVNRSKQLNLPTWDATAKRLLINMMIPLVAGGLLCLVLIQQGQLVLLASITLIFYGMALVNASKYSLEEIRTLGILEIILGLIAAWQPDQALLCWSVGFGILHIGYGLLIHNKHQK